VTEPDLLEPEEVLELHERQIEAFGGNKRTGLGAALLFLRLNGFRVVDPEETLYEAMIAIAERRLDKSGLAAALERLARPADEAGEPR
jgi:death on curing protein